jgi:hypothetical protein
MLSRVEGEIVIVQCDQDWESFLLSVDRKSGKQRWKTARPGVGIGWSVPMPPGLRTVSLSVQ